VSQRCLENVEGLLRGIGHPELVKLYHRRIMVEYIKLKRTS
jgi:hypothetical protein